MYKIVIIPIICLILTQSVKILIDASKEKFTWKSLTSYGGMPSSHSALVSSLVAIIALTHGFHSPEFAISLILSLIVIRDAVGLRRYVGEHSQVLNLLIKDLPDKEEYKYGYINERIGHSPTEALTGAIAGIGITIILYLLWV